MIELLKILFAGLFGLVVFWMFGFLIRTTLKVSNSNNPYMECFINMALGGLMVAVLTAIWRTSGNTILWGAFIPLAFIYFQQHSPKPSPTSKKFINKENVGVFAYAILVVLVSLSYYLILYFKPPFHAIPHFDEGFYAMLGVKNYFFGIESFKAVSMLHSKPGNTPYHYPELWINSLVFKFLNINQVIGHGIVVKSWLTAIVAMGLRGLTRQVNGAKILEYLSVLPMFIVPFLLDYNRLVQGSSLIHSNKGLVVGAAIVFWMNCYFSKYKMHWVVLLMLPILNISTAPAVFLSLSMFLIIKLIIDFKNNNISNWYSLITVFFTALFVAVFYYLQSGNSEKIPNQILFIKSCYTLPIFIQNAYKHWANSILYLPCLLIPICYSIIKHGFVKSVKIILKPVYKNSSLLGLFSLTWLSGIITSFAFFPFAGWDSGQLHTMSAGAFFPIIIWLCLIWFVRYLNSKSLILNLNIFFLLIYCVFLFHQTKLYYRILPETHRSNEYLNQVKSLLEDNKFIYFGVSLLAPNEFRFMEESGARNDLMNTYRVNPFSTSMPPLYLYNLNTLDLKGFEIQDLQDINFKTYDSRLKYYKIMSARKDLLNSPFYIFSSENSNKKSIIKVLELHYQWAFIRKLKPEFIILSKEAVLPIDWMPFIEKSLVDKLSGEQFMKFKPWS